MASETNQSETGLLTLFARKERTTDAVSVKHGLGHRLDTVLYEDSECTRRKARFGWFQQSCPRRGQTRVTLNCWRWALVWV